MSFRHTLTERVQFADTDMAGIVHFSNFFRYMERVEHDFFRSLELSIREDPAKIPEAECVGWPRVHASCDYKAPLFFEEQFTMELLVEEVRSKTVRYMIRFWKLTGELCAEGRIIAACVRRDPATGKMKAVEIPSRCLAKIQTAPSELLTSAVSPK
ncbi:MAG: thioesterase family protein [Verrucomicrobia bacterium]|nr:thioesterase family protein [Verrucomicrobiota bacterium]